MIRHTVVFTLRHPLGSAEETAFLDAGLALAELPMVRNFERLRQVSAKIDYDYGFSMEFEDQAAYATYDAHPVHVAFVRDRWLPEVADFLEIDYVTLPA